MSLRCFTSSPLTSRVLYPLVGIYSDKPRTNSAALTQRTYSKQVLNHYTALELTPKASQAQIKTAYYRLSKKYHPDMNKSFEAKARFNAISEAYEILGNKLKREQYDNGFGRHTGFPGGAATSVDVEYQEFLRKQGMFGQRGRAPTGRTNIYNFDEFYRMHYGESLKNKQKVEAAKEEYEKEMAERRDSLKKSMVFFTIFMLLSLYGISR